MRFRTVMMIWGVGLVFTGGAMAQFELTGQEADGTLTWSNTPADSVAMVQESTALTGEWAAVAMQMSGEDFTLSLPDENTLFYRIQAHSVTQIVHYPLVSDANDALGLNDPIQLDNCPFTNGGIYCSGIYSGEGASSAVTPDLEALDFNGFIMSVEFMVMTNNEVRPILVGGDTWRWGGVYLQSFDKIGLMVNSATYAGSLTYTTGVWHEVAFVYTATNETSELYFDGQLAKRVVAALNHNNNNNFTDVNSGNGGVFKGYLRNLRVWNFK